MIRLKRTVSAERGASTIFVAIFFMGASVVLGAAALSIDIGKLTWERRELQNGADAAALSLAQSCAKGNCVENADGLLSLTQLNAADGLHEISGQCAMNVTSTTLGGCPTGSVDDLGECPPVPSAKAALKYVEVRTRSLSSEGGFVRNLFSSAANGTEQTVIASCSRAAWGPPGGATVLPLTFSYCEYEQIVNTAGYGDPTVDPFTGETSLALQYKTGANPCPGDYKMDGPGGFGWIGSGDCEVPIDDGDIVISDTGADPTLCFEPGDTVLIPIYDEYMKTGKTYHIDGFAAFYITGWEFAGTKDALTGHPGTAAKNECKVEANNGKFCLFGMFLEGYVDGTGAIDPNGDDYGAVTVQPMG